MSKIIGQTELTIFFSQLKVTSSEVLSSRGFSSFQVEIQAVVHGNNMVC